MTKIEDQLKLRFAIDAVSDGFHELRVVSVADSPTANRTSRRLEFVIDRKKQRISLETASTKIQIGGKLKLTAIANTGDRIQIQQNSRTLVSLNSGEIVEIAASKIGSGRTQLQAGQPCVSAAEAGLSETSSQTGPLKNQSRFPYPHR